MSASTASTAEVKSCTAWFSRGGFGAPSDPSPATIGRYPYALATDVKKCPNGRVRPAKVQLADGRIRERDVHK